MPPSDRDAANPLLSLLDWTPEFYFGLPEANAETGGCPNCGGLHYRAALRVYRDRPCVYKCQGTEYPNADDAPYKPACGSMFRGRPGIHFDAAYFADFLAERAA